MPDNVLKVIVAVDPVGVVKGSDFCFSCHFGYILDGFRSNSLGIFSILLIQGTLDQALFIDKFLLDNIYVVLLCALQLI